MGTKVTKPTKPTNPTKPAKKQEVKEFDPITTPSPLIKWLTYKQIDFTLDKIFVTNENVILICHHWFTHSRRNTKILIPTDITNIIILMLQYEILTLKCLQKIVIKKSVHDSISWAFCQLQTQFNETKISQIEQIDFISQFLALNRKYIDPKLLTEYLFDKTNVIDVYDHNELLKKYLLLCGCDEINTFENVFRFLFKECGIYFQCIPYEHQYALLDALGHIISSNPNMEKAEVWGIRSHTYGYFHVLFLSTSKASHYFDLSESPMNDSQKQLVGKHAEFARNMRAMEINALQMYGYDPAKVTPEECGMVSVKF